MAIRGEMRRLSDFLPDILIEAQGCDELTAKASLRRVVEELCDIGFGSLKETREIDEGDVTEDDRWVRVSLCVEQVLRIHRVEVKSGCWRNVKDYLFEDGAVFIPVRYFPSDMDENPTHVCVSYDGIPGVDDEFQDSERLTRWRRLIISKVLCDLFSMEGQPWANGSRYQIYLERAQKLQESFVLTDWMQGGAIRTGSAAVGPEENVFC